MKKLSTLLLLIVFFLSKSSIAQNTPCTAQFNFTYQTNNTIQFTPAVTGAPTTVLHDWLFGDGGAANIIAPVHTYLSSGTYTARHIIVIFGTGTIICRDTFYRVIQVQSTATCNLLANFTSTIAAGSVNTVHFTNTTTPLNTTDSVRWTFGDGSESHDFNPTHTYPVAGTYNVCLRMQQRTPNGTLTNCVSEICHTVIVQNTTTCNLVANFTITPATATPNAFYFVNTSTPLNTTDSVHWTFGDGSSSTNFNATHTYAQPGTYNVCLRVQKRNSNGTLSNCISEICHTVIVQTTTVCNLVANFTTTPIAATPNAFHFTNTSTPLNTTDSVHWSFGDGTSSTDFNPTHTYLQSGTYTVCLRVQQRNPNGGLSNCIREICHTLVVQIPPTCNLLANFTSTGVAGTIAVIHFTNTSVPLNTTDSVHWTFGDGTSSTDFNPTHTYLQPGAYTVCLRVQQRHSNGTLSNCVSEICHTVIVQTTTVCNLVANFTITPVTATPNAFHFVNTSTPLNTTDSVRWTFGDGTSSNDLNPTHTYLQPGTYTVCLRVQQRTASGTLSNCVREICHTVVVQNTTTCNLVATFTATLLATTPLSLNTYHFENTSTPLNNTDSIRWTFGDGTSSNQVSPNHTYTVAGTYIVCLRIQQRNSNGTLSNCVREICHTVVVQNPNTCNLVANFTSTMVAGAVNTFHFVNTSTPLNTTDSVRWTFGDGTSSNNFNPTHTYLQPGTYTVCLRVQQRNLNGTLSNCIREICHTIVVQSTNTCNLVANFTSTQISTTPTGPSVVHFQNTSTPLNATDSIRWTFGDGTSSNDINPTHTYLQPGTYTVCLRIQQRNPNGTLTNCIREICHTIIVQNSAACNLLANFTILPLTTAANSYYFQNTSTPLNATDSIRWTFGDGTSSNQVSPIHTYLLPGNYNVCLRIQQRNPNGTLTNCVREICHTVFVQGPNTCNLIANFYSYRILVSGTAFPYLYHFENTSSPLNATDSIRWTFGDGTSSNQVSPNHAYTQPGNYTVCLRVIKRTSAGTLSNCTSETCHPLVVVAQNPNTCSLQPYPNPVTNSVNVNVVLGLPQMIDVYIYNTSNIQVKEKHQPGVTGNNIVTIATGDLVPGIYFMKVIHGNDVCYATFVKL